MNKDQIRIRLYYLITLLITIFLFGACKQTRNNEYTISGKLNNYNGASSLILVKERIDSLTIYSQDTISINAKGEFSIKQKIDTLSLAMIAFNNGNLSHKFLIDKNEQIQVNGDLNEIETLEITGNKINNQVNDFNKIIRDNLVAIKLAKQNLLDSDSLKDNKDNRLLSELRNEQFELINKVSSYVKDNPSETSSVLIIDRFLRNDISFERLSESLKELKGGALDFPLFDKLMDYENFVKSFSKGASAPLIITKDINNNNYKLSNERNQYVVLAFTSFENNEFDETYNNIEKEYNQLKLGKTRKTTTRKNTIHEEKIEYNVKFVIIVKGSVPKTGLAKNLNKNISVILASDGWSNKIFVEYNITHTPFYYLINTYGRIDKRDFQLDKIKSTLDNSPKGFKEIQKK